jgi:hypothetical protein
MNFAEFSNLFVFCELHNIKKADVSSITVVDVYHNLYLLSNGMVIHYSQETRTPSLILPKFEDVLSPESLSQKSIQFDRFTEIIPITKGGLLVRVAWYTPIDKYGRWVINFKNVVQSSAESVGTTTYEKLLDKHLSTLDKTKSYIFYIFPSQTSEKADSLLFSSYVYVGQTVRREIAQNRFGTSHLKTVESVANYCKNNNVDVLYYHPSTSNYIMLDSNTLSKIQCEDASSHISRCNYVSLYFEHLCTNGLEGLESADFQVPRNRQLENQIRELIEYLFRIGVYGRLGTICSPAENELLVSISNTLSHDSPDVYRTIIQILSTTNPKSILSLIKEMNERNKTNVC